MHLPSKPPPHANVPLIYPTIPHTTQPYIHLNKYTYTILKKSINA